jgi:hypothetical protein
MLVPDEIALRLHDGDLVIVHQGNELWRVGRVEHPQMVFEVHFVHIE